MCTCDEIDLCCYFKDPENSPSNQNVCTENQLEQPLDPEKIESSLINVTPSILKFPYNNPKCHSQRLTLWNRTIESLRIRIKSPDQEVFKVCIDKQRRAKRGSVNQVQLYGLAAKTISIKCTPGRYKIARFSLQLFVYTSHDKCECVGVPLEIYPSTSWFQLPKEVVIPDVTIGRKAHALILLPQPKVSERFFVTFHSIHGQNAITLSPMNGTIGGDDGIKQLKITYAPVEYTTVSCSIKVHFPGFSSGTAHEITIIGRCRPGNEADVIRKEVAEIESFRPKQDTKKRKFPKLTFHKAKDTHPSVQSDKMGNDSVAKALSLFTNGGVMRFLLSKGNIEKHYKDHQDSHSRKTAIEHLVSQVDLHHDEKVKIYNSIRQRLGFDFDGNYQHTRPRLKSNELRDWEEFQKAVGVPLMGKVQYNPFEESSGPVPINVPDSSRKSTHTRESYETSRSGSSNKSKSALKTVRQSVSEDEQRMYKNMMADVQLDLTAKQRFVQLALIVITRHRADKRLSKIKVLVEETKRTAKRRASRAGSSMKTPPGKHTRASIKQGRQSEFDPELQSKEQNGSKQLIGNKSRQSIAKRRKSTTSTTKEASET